MSAPGAAALLIDRQADRVDYLCEERYGHVGHDVTLDADGPYRFEAGVFRFINGETGSPRDVSLRLSAGPFRFQDSLSVADARLLALALNVAADEAEAAGKGEAA